MPRTIWNETTPETVDPVRLNANDSWAANEVAPIKGAVLAATTTALPTNTISGNVLTATANGALGVIDGQTLTVGTGALSRVLVNHEASLEHNGIYSLTQAGDATHPWILTRATDCDSDAETLPGMQVPVLAGAQKGYWYLNVPSLVRVNIDAQNWSLIVNPNPMTQLGDLITGGAGGAPGRLGGVAAAVRKFLRSLGDGTNPLALVWDFITSADISDATSAATPSKAVIRDASGRAQFADPAAAQDAATLNSVTTAIAAAVQGLSVKVSVVVMATANVALMGLQTIDGVTLTEGQRVLLTGQTTASQNGPWQAHSGAWTRPLDFATGASEGGAFVFVESGTANAGSGWTLLGAGPITVDTTAQSWTQFSGAGEIIAGAGLIKSGNTLSLAAGSARSAIDISPQAVTFPGRGNYRVVVSLGSGFSEFSYNVIMGQVLGATIGTPQSHVTVECDTNYRIGNQFMLTVYIWSDYPLDSSGHALVNLEGHLSGYGWTGGAGPITAAYSNIEAIT